MYKKFLSGVLAAAMVIGGAAYAAKPASVDAAGAPKPKYTFSMNGASKNVVGVARKGDTSAGTLQRRVSFRQQTRKLNFSTRRVNTERLFTFQEL